MKSRLLKISFFSFVLFVCLSQAAHAGTEGHYYPGVMGMRDIILPPQGFYAIYYDPIYYSNDLRDANGNSVSEISASKSETKDLRVYGHDIPVQLSGGLSADINTSMIFRSTMNI